jgi:hypothetical protein
MSDPRVVVVRPIRWDRLRTDEAEREIQRRLKINAPFVSDHAFERLDEREEQGRLNSADMLKILQAGSVCKEPRRENNGWMVIVEKRMPGSRQAGVVTVIVVPGDDLEVITVQWMDWS